MRSDPYPWPWDGAVAGERLALVVAGWDTHWRARGGAVDDVDAAEQRLSHLGGVVVALGGVVLAVHHDRPPRASRQWPDPRPLDHIPLGLDAVAVGAPATDAFLGGYLESELRRRGLTHLLIAGHGLEGPVHSTLRSANDRGYECLLVTDACSALTTDAAHGARHSVTMSGGIFGAVADCAAVVAAAVEPEVPELQEMP